MRRTGMLLAMVLAAPGCSAGEVTVSSGYIREAPPGKTITAAYCDITNGSTEPVAVVSVSSPAAKVVEIHATQRVGDTLRMQPLDRLDLAAGETVHLKSGQTHLMLFDAVPLTEPRYPVVFELSNGASVTGTFAVEPLMPPD